MKTERQTIIEKLGKINIKINLSFFINQRLKCIKWALF